MPAGIRKTQQRLSFRSGSPEFFFLHKLTVIASLVDTISACERFCRNALRSNLKLKGYGEVKAQETEYQASSPQVSGGGDTLVILPRFRYNQSSVR